ncbi:MAG TPA: DUF2975 domain-containing protein [Candidatus Bariatricus faecipullorum]|nr:DUF2975 domain-containing protein [Candidatus Bariatricus faecipullorum]
MQSKTRKIVMALVGAYLTYTGVELVLAVQREKPENSVLFMVFGIIFALFGVATVIVNIRELLKIRKSETDSGASEEPGEPAEEFVETDGTAENEEEEEEEEEEDGGDWEEDEENWDEDSEEDQDGEEDEDESRHGV